MLTNKAEIERLMRAARLYYEQNLTQQEIADQLGVSRPLISKMLAKARDLGIVTVNIKSPFENNALASQRLIAAYGLKGALVVPDAKSDFLTEQMLLTRTAGLLPELLSGVRCAGFGWGGLLDELAGLLPEGLEKIVAPGAVACPLIGSATVSSRGYNTNEVVRRFAERTGMTARFLFAPAFPMTAAERDAYTGTSNFTALKELWGAMDFAVVRIMSYPSTPDHATALRFGNRLAAGRAAGSILSYFYDASGTFIEGENDFLIACGRETLRSTPTVLGVCAGNTSAAAIAGALSTGLITHVVLSESKALAVISRYVS